MKSLRKMTGRRSLPGKYKQNEAGALDRMGEMYR